MPSVKIRVAHNEQYKFDKVIQEVEQKEAAWQREWDSILCPFAKVTVYCSEERRAKRKALYDKLNKARERIDAARAKKRKETI